MSIHHVTAIAGEPQRNLDFYAGVLGLRLVKLTVNFDDPASYHFYFGDELGRPGSILTFFAWPGGRRGRQGTGQVGTVSLAVPAAALGYWIERLVQHGIRFDGPARRFDEQVLSFTDPDGLLLELVASPRVDRVEPWTGGPVPAAHAVRGVLGATIWEDGERGTAEVLTGQLGYRLAGEDAGRVRFESAGEGAGTVVDLRRVPGFWAGADGVGTVHHVAFRAATDDDQLARRERLTEAGLQLTPVVDRQYFRSVYFREPGGVLFEIATDGPGFTVDEPAGGLGGSLKLPPQFEPLREQIEQAVPPVRLPAPALESLTTGGEGQS
jgi:catechol 2,3-dioxygenase-like lactoylglutathione lyase family enzyme